MTMDDISYDNCVSCANQDTNVGLTSTERFQIKMQALMAADTHCTKRKDKTEDMKRMKFF